jgi:excisionase family DNA binding protein
MHRHADTGGSPAMSFGLAPLALSAEQVAKLLGISRAHLWRLHSSGRVPRPLRFGRAVRWDRGTLERWLAAGAPTREQWETMNESMAYGRRR